MLAVLTIATVFIAVVLTVVHWRTVREILLWSAAIINVLSMLFGLLALFSAVIVFIWAAIVQNAALVPLGISLVLVFFGLLVVVGVLSAVEERDRDKQFSKFRAWTLAKFCTNKSSALTSPRTRAPSEEAENAAMTNGHGIETPANKIATAQAVLSLTFRLNSEVMAGRIDDGIFTSEVTVITGASGVRLPAFPEGTTQDLQLGTFNLVQIALSASALTVDETLDQVFGKLSADPDSNRVGLRVMVNQLRNAFAHNPWRPKWVVFPKYRNKYPITLDDTSTFTFDATSLDGDGVKPEHIGGLEFWVKLLQHCERSVSVAQQAVPRDGLAPLGRA
jgi:hypothetical protein